jgi:hypothetical protein
MQIPTGPVVVFRNKEVIKNEGEISKECALFFFPRQFPVGMIKELKKGS